MFTAISKEMLHVADAITTSSLSNEDINQLIDQLLDKMDTNVEVSFSFLLVMLHLLIHVMTLYPQCFCRLTKK